MKEETINLFLNGLEVNHFLVFYAWAVLGGVLSFFYTVDQRIKFAQDSPNKWSWPHFFMGMKRVFTTIIGMAIFIIFWDNISQFLFEAESKIELTPWAAFLFIGIGFDKLSEKIFGKGKEYINKMKKK